MQRRYARWCCIASLVAYAGVIAGCGSSNNDPDNSVAVVSISDQQKVGLASNSFAATGLHHDSTFSLGADPAWTDNVESPYDFARLLGILMVGARNETLDDLRNALAIDADVTTWPELFYSVDDSLATPFNDSGIGYANVFSYGRIQEGYVVSDSYLSALRYNFRLEHYSTDFTQGSVNLMPILTPGPIELMPLAAQMLDPITTQANEIVVGVGIYIADSKRIRLVQTSRSGLSAAWNTGIDTIEVFDGLFERPDGTQIRLPMLRHSGTFPTYEGPDVTATKIPLANTNWSLIVATPADATKIEELKSELIRRFAGDTVEWRQQSVSVVTPTFDIYSTYDLIGALYNRHVVWPMQESYIPAVADQAPTRADFSGVNDAGFLYLSAVKGNTSVTLDADGIGAHGEVYGALSATSDEPRSACPGCGGAAHGVLTYGDQTCPRVYVKAGPADATPFVFVLRHEPTGVILVDGRIAMLTGVEAGRWEQRCEPPIMIDPTPPPEITQN